MRTRPLVTAGARGAIAAALPFGESTGRSAAHVPATERGVRPRRSSAAVKTEAVVAFASPSPAGPTASPFSGPLSGVILYTQRRAPRSRCSSMSFTKCVSTMSVT